MYYSFNQEKKHMILDVIGQIPFCPQVCARLCVKVIYVKNDSNV